MREFVNLLDLCNMSSFSLKDIKPQRRQDQSQCEHQPQVLQGAAGARGRRRPQEGIWGLASRCRRW